MSADDFSRELGLRDLLPKGEADRLVAALRLILGDAVALVEASGDSLAGQSGLHDDQPVPLVIEIEPIGYLFAPAAPATLRGACGSLIHQVLLARRRYLLASAVHVHAIHDDYEQLQQQNAALLASEAKYKALSESLEQRVAEQTRLIDERQRQLYQAERLASVGQLAAGVAHEINNPIGFVRSNLSTAQKYLDRIESLGVMLKTQAPSPWQEADMDFLLTDFRELLDESVGGVDRVTRIVSDLKGFSSVDKPQEEVVDINELVANVCAMAERNLPAGSRLTRSLGESKPLLSLPGHLSQAFLAVIQNAIQAIQPRGSDGEVSVASHFAASAMFITIRDNGCGIPVALLPRVFDPFFTTRSVGQGTGLGLTVARDIVRAHGGDIVVESAPDQGTTVTIKVPE